MGKADWSLDQLERDLGEGFALLGRAERSGGLGAGEASALADGVLRCMNGALQKVSESLETQAAMRRELAALREELRLQREERRAAATAQEERIRALENELASLRSERERMRQTLCRLSAEQAPTTPADAFLAQPLVLRSPQGEFLGVADRGGQPLCLADFQRLVEQGGGPGRLVATVWDRHGGSWCLTLGVSGPGADAIRCYVLEAEPCRTPSGNQVTVLKELHVDGAAVPQDFVLQMFRQLRESFQE